MTFLGHIIGNGQVKSIHAKIQAIVNYPVPKDKKELMCFLGMIGYYRRFCHNFSLSTLSSQPILLAPDFQKFLDQC